MRPSYLYYGDPCTSKTSLYWFIYAMGPMYQLDILMLKRPIVGRKSSANNSKYYKWSQPLCLALGVFIMRGNSNIHRHLTTFVDRNGIDSGFLKHTSLMPNTRSWEDICLMFAASSRLPVLIGSLCVYLFWAWMNWWHIRNSPSNVWYKSWHCDFYILFTTSIKQGVRGEQKTLGHGTSEDANIGQAWPLEILICLTAQRILSPNFRLLCDFL